MKKLIIIGALLLGLALPGLAQDIITPGMGGVQTRNAINTAFSQTLGVVDTVNETIRIGGVQITANATEVNSVLDGALVNVTELNRLVGIPGNIVTLLAGKENSLGNPGTSGYVLSSTSGGTRSWITPGGGAVYPSGTGVPFVNAGTSWGTTVTTVSQTELEYIDGLNGTAASRQNINDSLDQALANAVEVIAKKDSTGTDPGNYVTHAQLNAFSGGGNNTIDGIVALGGSVKALPLIVGYNPTVAHTFSDGTCYGVAIYVSEAMTVTGAAWMQSVAGVYTGDNYNGFGLYSVTGTNYDLVASTTNDSEIWKATASTLVSKAFSSPASLSAGVYYLVALYNQSAQTTAPAIWYSPDRTTALQLISGSNKLSFVRYSTLTLPSQITLASIFANTETPCIWLY